MRALPRARGARALESHASVRICMHVSLIPTTPLLASRNEEEDDEMPIMAMIIWPERGCAPGSIGVSPAPNRLTISTPPRPAGLLICHLGQQHTVCLRGFGPARLGE